MIQIKKFSFYIVFAVIIIFPGAMEAQTKLGNPLGANNNSLMGLIDKIIKDAVMPIGAMIVTFAIIYSGFLFVTARGNKLKLDTAKLVFLWTVVGAAVLLGSYVLMEVVRGTVNQISPGSVPPFN